MRNDRGTTPRTRAMVPLAWNDPHMPVLGPTFQARYRWSSRSFTACGTIAERPREPGRWFRLPGTTRTCPFWDVLSQQMSAIGTTGWPRHPVARRRLAGRPHTLGRAAAGAPGGRRGRAPAPGAAGGGASRARPAPRAGAPRGRAGRARRAPPGRRAPRAGAADGRSRRAQPAGAAGGRAGRHWRARRTGAPGGRAARARRASAADAADAPAPDNHRPGSASDPGRRSNGAAQISWREAPPSVPSSRRSTGHLPATH
jgi:hypothetical protein